MPYAAKATIEHEFDTDHLNIWLTFRNPMDILVKPSLDKFMVKIDGTVFYPDSSDWQDTYTLLLVVTAVVASPARLLVSYIGPSILLRTTWHKQWEPWGYIYSHNLAA